MALLDDRTLYSTRLSISFFGVDIHYAFGSGIRSALIVWICSQTRVKVDADGADIFTFSTRVTLITVLEKK